MMIRRDLRWWEEDSWEIYTKLPNDMYVMTDFLETCTYFLKHLVDIFRLIDTKPFVGGTTMKRLLVVSLFLLLSINLIGCGTRNESDIKAEVYSDSNIEIYENVERNTKSHTWYNFREELPLEKKEIA